MIFQGPASLAGDASFLLRISDMRRGKNKLPYICVDLSLDYFYINAVESRA